MSTKRPNSLGLSSLFFLSAFTGATLPARAASLDSRLNDLLNSPLVKGASISLDIVEVENGKPVTLYSHDATTPLGPASNCKLLTTAAAFETYGPKATFKTTLYRVGPDLVLVGGGDPGFGDSKIAAANHETPTSTFEQWATLLKNANITQYRDLIVDDRVFDHTWTHPNWPADQRLDWYCAPVGGLNFNANCLDWIPKLTSKGVSVELVPDTTYVSVAIKATKGSETKVSMFRPAESNKMEMRGTVANSSNSPYNVPIYDPSLWTATIFSDILNRSGVQSTGHIRRIDAAEQIGQGKLLATHETPILSVIKRANTNSLNMMAEGLCKRLGYDSTKGKEPGSWTNGTAAVQSFVTSIGGKADWVSLDDGSGLSNKNKVAAKAFTTVLAHIAARPDGDQFIQTLAVPGVDGTLEKRFKGMAVATHIHAKTGHITGVSSLSGFIILTGGRTFAFSILVNKYQGNVNPWQDDVCEAIYQWASGK